GGSTAQQQNRQCHEGDASEHGCAYFGAATENGMSPWIRSSPATVRTAQCSTYFPGGRVGARANSTSGADSSRGCKRSTSLPSCMTSRVERMWSTGRSKCTKNALVRLSITAFAAGVDCMTRISSAAAGQDAQTQDAQMRADNSKPATIRRDTIM